LGLVTAFLPAPQDVGVVRTDRRRLRPLVRDTTATTALRTSVRARRDLVEHRVAAANQLRAHLQIVFPAAAGMFAAIDSAISLTFLERFTTQTHADWLSVKRIASWLSSVGYSGHTTPDVLHTRLLAAPRGTTGNDTAIHAVTTRAFVSVLRVLNTQITALADSIGEQLTIHPDAHIITSLPRSGTVRAARLLAEIGDARGRDAVCDFDFAGDSRHANPWAAQPYANAIAREHDHPHADVRILGRAWIHIIWRCWQDNLPYDPTQHRALQTLLTTTADKAA